MDNHPKKLYRSRKDRILGGVCGGLGQYFDIDPILVRIVFVLLVLADGAGLLIYLILLIVIPQEPGEEVEINRREKVKEFVERVGEVVREFKKDKNWWQEKRNIIALIIIVIGFILLINQFYFWHWFRWHLFWPILIIIIGLYFIFKKRK